MILTSYQEDPDNRNIANNNNVYPIAFNVWITGTSLECWHILIGEGPS